jgi:hypothetical protein
MRTTVALISLLIGCLTVSTLARCKVAANDVSSPQIKVALDLSNLPDSVQSVLAMLPTAPRGPSDLLRGYEDDMQAVSARFVNELTVVSKAFAERQITRDQAEHLSEERYLVAMMQFELLSALHAQLEQEIELEEHSPKDLDSAREMSIAVVELPFYSFHLNPSLTRYLELTSWQVQAIQEIMSDERHKQRPLLEKLQVTRLQLLRVNQQANADDKELHTLAGFQGTVISKLIVANSRMQARIYEVLDAGQRRKLQQFQRAKAVTTAGAE